MSPNAMAGIGVGLLGNLYMVQLEVYDSGSICCCQNQIVHISDTGRFTYKNTV